MVLLSLISCFFQIVLKQFVFQILKQLYLLIKRYQWMLPLSVFLMMPVVRAGGVISGRDEISPEASPSVIPDDPVPAFPLTIPDDPDSEERDLSRALHLIKELQRLGLVGL
ncbi:hypothetical protein TNIN_389841 [Trichonephila inaurata madagascariensis]|uniref:Uncharacterized protein n=1 Tax=Trichonephila inaurata madagascariensis TaxID=2747483 RepID=A0A8X7C0D6_9ARAC|nr:hypothetical protein TNIN_389841 [Trichonephila inaurata madagascariensis]